MNSLLKDRRFLPLLMTAVLGALNDNLLKSAIVVFAAMSVPAEEAARIGLLAGGLLMLPFVLFSGMAGVISDRFEKARIIQMTKLSELVLAMLATAVFLSGSSAGALGIVFLMGTQSAFFGPLKTGWLPERLHGHEIMRANAWLESGTFLAILGGTIAGGLVAGQDSLAIAGVCAIALATVGLVTSLRLPKGVAASPDLKVSLNPVGGNLAILKGLFGDRTMGRSALLIAWFWAAGSVCLSILPAYLRERIDADETVLTLVMALFALGIGAGAFAANKILKGRVGLSILVPSAALVCAAAGAMTWGLAGINGTGIAALISGPKGIATLAGLFGVAFAGGAFAIPLKAVIQTRAPAEARARTLAALNIVTSLSVALTSGIIALAVAVGMGVEDIFMGVTVSAAAALVASVAFFPRAALQWAIGAFLKAWFRVEVVGKEHLSTEGPVIFAANHISLLDGPLLFSLIDRDCSIAMNTGWAQKPFLRHLAKLIPVAPIDPQRPMAAKTLAQRVKAGDACLIFPEGRISTHAALMKVYPGTAWLVDAASAPIVNITIDGFEVSAGARRKPGFRRKLFPKVRIVVDAPRQLGVDPDLRGRLRREAATRALQDILEDGRRRILSSAPTLPHAFAQTRSWLGGKEVVISDPLGTALSRKKIAIGGAVFSRLLQSRTEKGEVVGVLLPGVASVPVILMGLWRSGRVPAMLNPTLGSGPSVSALETASIKRVMTSRDFVEKAGLQDMISAFEASGREILWTEDLKASVSTTDKVAAFVAQYRATDLPVKSEDPAAILFTSGTEGAPKGVVLSHANILANIAQLRARTDISPADRVLSALPLFHSLGLTGGVLMPLVSGAKVSIYPSPLHYRVIPEMAYADQSTLIFGTDTFLAGWGRRASSYDFSSVRAAIAGAEAVKESTRKMWSERFGVRILEGYGATEASPVLALNTPILQKAGTVGRMLSGIETRLEEVPGVEGARLWVRGPNIMAGYLLPGAPGDLQAPEDGWYDTGDVVSVDDEGFVSIQGRLKRFAKIGGEMVSLGAVEKLAAKTWPNVAVAAISLPDTRKGERVVLAVEQQGASRQDILALARGEGVAEILLPAEVVVISKLPLLASGKPDYPALTLELTDLRARVA